MWLSVQRKNEEQKKSLVILSMLTPHVLTAIGLIDCVTACVPARGGCVAVGKGNRLRSAVG